MLHLLEKRFLVARCVKSILPLCLLACVRGDSRGIAKPVASTPQGANLWSIGIATGPSPLQLQERLNPPNPIFSWRSFKKPDAAFVADPFLVRERDQWFVFFELFNLASGRGEIAVARSADLHTWTFDGVVLAEPFHLSYPFVFKEGDSYYMVPESRAAQEVRLYKARSFPKEWVLDTTLVRGNFSDSSPVYFYNRWWMFTCESPYSLKLFFADSLKGPWTSHPSNPIYVDDPSKSRPAGRPVVVDGKIARFVQDNRGGYGKRVRVMIVDDISPTTFREHEAEQSPLFEAHGKHWSRNGMHHVSPIQLRDKEWVAAVDGSGDGWKE